MSYCILLSCAVAALFVPYFVQRMYAHEWHQSPFFDQMQRRIGGKWEYRDMTHEEKVERFDAEAW